VRSQVISKVIMKEILIWNETSSAVVEKSPTLRRKLVSLEY